MESLLNAATAAAIVLFALMVLEQLRRITRLFPRDYERLERIEKLLAEIEERLRDKMDKGPDQDPWVRDTIRAAAKKLGLVLTPAAMELIALPIEEAKERDSGAFNLAEVSKSIGIVLDSLATLAGPADRPNERNAQDVVRAFFEKFCNIPPICDRKGQPAP